jgi:hypothetical protein
MVAEEHSKSFPEKERDEASLKLKYQKLWKTKAGTGNPNIPSYIREAMEIQTLINT